MLSACLCFIDIINVRFAELKLRELAEEGKVDRLVWKTMQTSLLSDLKKLTDLILAIEWEDGLSDDQVAILRNYIGKWVNTEPGVTGEGSLIDGPKASKATFRVVGGCRLTLADSVKKSDLVNYLPPFVKGEGVRYKVQNLYTFNCSIFS